MKDSKKPKWMKALADQAKAKVKHAAGGEVKPHSKLCPCWGCSPVSIGFKPQDDVLAGVSQAIKEMADTQAFKKIEPASFDATITHFTGNQAYTHIGTVTCPNCSPSVQITASDKSKMVFTQLLEQMAALEQADAVTFNGLVMNGSDAKAPGKWVYDEGKGFSSYSPGGPIHSLESSMPVGTGMTFKEALEAPAVPVTYKINGAEVSMQEFQAAMEQYPQQFSKPTPMDIGSDIGTMAIKQEWLTGGWPPSYTPSPSPAFVPFPGGTTGYTPTVPGGMLGYTPTMSSSYYGDSLRLLKKSIPALAEFDIIDPADLSADEYDTDENVYHRYRLRADCPVPGCAVVDKPLSHVIIHLNDEERWPRVAGEDGWEVVQLRIQMNGLEKAIASEPALRGQERSVIATWRRSLENCRAKLASLERAAAKNSQNNIADWLDEYSARTGADLSFRAPEREDG